MSIKVWKPKFSTLCWQKKVTFHVFRRHSMYYGKKPNWCSLVPSVSFCLFMWKHYCTLTLMDPIFQAEESRWESSFRYNKTKNTNEEVWANTYKDDAFLKEFACKNNQMMYQCPQSCQEKKIWQFWEHELYDIVFGIFPPTTTRRRTPVQVTVDSGVIQSQLLQFKDYL